MKKEMIDKIDIAMVAKGMVIEHTESLIDQGETLYLVTWSPDPSELPDADFETQHLFNVNLLADYLKACSCGLFCVETTQLGNPHYHGWYQLSASPEKEAFRIVLVKTLQRFGLLKITKSKGHYRINSYTSHGNCLAYYKKDLVGSMLFVGANPITSDTKCDIDWKNNLLYFGDSKKRSSLVELQEKISLKNFYMEFYKDSRPL